MRLTPSTTEIPALDLDWDYEKPLLVFLRQSTDTADYNNELTWPVLARRVMGLLALLMDDQLCQEAMSCVVQSGSGDNGKIRALNKLEALA